MSRRKKPQCEGNIDPQRLDLNDRPKRGRKPVLRHKEATPEAAKPWIAEARKRKMSRPVSIGVTAEPREEGGRWNYRFESPYDNEDDWVHAMADAFGTRSHAVIGMFLDHLSELASECYDHSHETWKPDERHINAALAIINATRPKDELGAMLCAQAVAVHWMQMRAAGSLLGRSTGYVDPRSASVCSQLARTFVQQVEAIDRRNRKDKSRTVRQVITVKRETHQHTHQHVHLEGGGSLSDHRPHGTGAKTSVGEIIDGAGEPSELATLRSQDESRQIVPFPSRPGEEALQAPRRSAGKRRPEG